MYSRESKIDLTLHTFSCPKLESAVCEAIDFLNSTPEHPLPPGTGFTGSGVYALYYQGNFPLYRFLAEENNRTCMQPIYVGKAVPSGWRTARRSILEEGRTLYQRLREHARSIQQVSNLSVEDFRVRFMILTGLESDLVVPVEAELIRCYTPLWNCIVDGFGNHDPGRGRYNQAKSEWDVLHPGRSWAERLLGASPDLSRIESKVRQKGG